VAWCVEEGGGKFGRFAFRALIPRVKLRGSCSTYVAESVIKTLYTGDMFNPNPSRLSRVLEL
jgi:hypothetical protein